MYLLISREEKRRDEEVRGVDGIGRMGTVRAGAILPFHGPSDLEERVACLPAESETELRAGVPFTLADINGFQPIRAKWNG